MWTPAPPNGDPNAPGARTGAMLQAETAASLASNPNSRFIMQNGNLINNPGFKEFMPAQDIHNLYSTATQGQSNVTPASTAAIDPNYSAAWNEIGKPATWGGLGGLGGMKPPAQPQPDYMAMFKQMMDQQAQQQQGMMDKWGEMAGFNQPKEGMGSGQWGNFGGNTSPVYRPNEPTNQARNGWGGPFGSNNPFAPTV